jgi:hypothetical protein
VVRQPVDDDLVGGHLAPGVVRRLHGLPGLGGRRLRRCVRRLLDLGEATGVRRGRAPVLTPGRAGARGRGRRRRGVQQLRRDLLRQGELGDPAARDLARRRALPGRGERLLRTPPLRQRDADRLRRRARQRHRP